MQASPEAAAAPAAAATQQEQQQGFFARIGTVLFKIMLFQTLINFVASFFVPKPQAELHQLPPLTNVLSPNAQFDVFMHLHYLPSPGVSAPPPAKAAAAEGPSASGLFQMYTARLGAMQPPAAKDPLLLWGRTPLSKLLSPTHRETYCPRAAAAAAAAETPGAAQTAGEEDAGADKKPAAAAPAAAAAPKTPGAAQTAGGDAGAAAAAGGPQGELRCLSPRELPPATEVWRLLSQNYTYDWWSKSQTKETEFNLLKEFLEDEDLLLVLTVTAVPHTAYDGNRHEMAPEEVAAAAAAVPVERLIQRSHSLVQRMRPFRDEDEEHSLLLGGEEERQAREEEEKTEPIRHLKKHLDVSLVYDTSAHTPATLAAGPLQELKLRLSAGEYEPMLDISDFWLIEKHFIPLNETLAGQPQQLSFSFGVGSVHAWLVQSQMTGMQQQQQQMGLQSDREAFMFKRVVLETNPFLLIFSAIFILSHSVFSFFAFKNDMQFWYKNESMEGLSASSLIFGFVCELVIGLYLFDSRETSWLILFEVIVGVAISAWKLTKAVRFERTNSFPFLGVSFTKSYSDSKTKEFDRTAIKYASIALAPCLVGYAVYALLHNKYRSWYSYIISVLAGSVYTFGFVLMTPQLYINYKLKSVDHLPWRALIYRSLNTFVDDVASFLIDMPWMHRLSCFRDDIIFIVYLYQRWIYRVDKSRTLGAEAEGPQTLTAGGPSGAPAEPDGAPEASGSCSPVLAAAEAAAKARHAAAAADHPETADAADAARESKAEGLRRRLPHAAAAGEYES